MVTVGPRCLKDHEVQGAIFDVDGTLIDSMALFYPSWPLTGTLPEFGLEVSEEEFYLLAGRPVPDMVQHLHLTQKGVPATPDFVAAFLAEKVRQHALVEAERGPPAPIPSVVKLARDYKARGIPVAIATSGLKEHVLHHLVAAGLDDLVESRHIVFTAEVLRGKPDPAIYLEAARRIGVDPGRCRAYEDAESGLRAAVAAGMEVIDVTFMEGYPSPPALREAKEQQRRARTWLSVGP